MKGGIFMNQNDLPNLTPAQQEALLKTASQKLGIPVNQLENAVKSGNFNSVINQKGLNIEKYLNNPKIVENFLSDPKNQATIKKMMGGG